MKIDEDYDYNNFYNNKIDSNIYTNSENQSELDNKIENISSSSLNNKKTVLNQIENEFLKEINLYKNKNLYTQINCYNYVNDDFSFLEDNKHEMFEDEFFANNEKYIEQNNKKVKENEISNTITISKRVIKTFNNTVSNVINDLFPQKDEIDYDTMKNMQLIKSKKRRRTKKEIEEDKRMNTEKAKKIKSRGRTKKSEIINFEDSHSKIADDNIIKKINTYFLKSINNWLNASFIDDRGNFLSPEKKFLKINTQEIFANLKKKEITKLMKTQFKEIFSQQISIKYKKYKPDSNKKLIEEIYKEDKQYFIIFILNLTFIDGLYIFDGEISIESFKKLIKIKNIEERTIIQFYNNFDKINSFLKKIYFQEMKNYYSEQVIQDYIHRISLLCINYENWFNRKYNRKSNKMNIE